MKEETKAELLMDHYKDTFQHILYHWKVRNRLFIYILVILAFLAIDTYSPGSLSELVNAYLEKQFGKAAPQFDLNIITTTIWFLMMSIIIQYYQRSIHVDRQYRYIDQIERFLCRELGGDYITREGKAYSSRTGVYKKGKGKKRPLYLQAVGPLYTYVFPIVLSIFTVLKILKDCQFRSFLQLIDFVIGCVIICFNVFYMIWVIKKN